MTRIVYHAGARCRWCGCSLGAHRVLDDACPPLRAWGDPRPLPPLTRGTEADADRSIADYWPTDGTVFERPS